MTPNISRRLDDYERGWVEAFIDAECYLSLTPNKETGGFKPFLGCFSTSKEQIDKLRYIVGSGAVSGPHSSPSHPGNHKPIWQYRLSANGLRTLLPQVTLVGKERQRILLLEYLAMVTTTRKPKDLEKANQIFIEMKRLNQKGR